MCRWTSNGDILQDTSSDQRTCWGIRIHVSLQMAAEDKLQSVTWGQNLDVFLCLLWSFLRTFFVSIFVILINHDNCVSCNYTEWLCRAVFKRLKGTGKSGDVSLSTKHFIKQVPIYFSCSGKCCNVLLGNSKNVKWTTKLQLTFNRQGNKKMITKIHFWVNLPFKGTVQLNTIMISFTTRFYSQFKRFLFDLRTFGATFTPVHYNESYDVWWV